MSKYEHSHIHPNDIRQIAYLEAKASNTAPDCIKAFVDGFVTSAYRRLFADFEALAEKTSKVTGSHETHTLETTLLIKAKPYEATVDYRSGRVNLLSEDQEYDVDTHSSNRDALVYPSPNRGYHCDCPDFGYRHKGKSDLGCKHIQAVAESDRIRRFLADDRYAPKDDVEDEAPGTYRNSILATYRAQQGV